MGQKVLLFGDIGIDDTIALIYAYLNKDIDLVGVVADYGNVSREYAVSNVHYLFKLLNFQTDIPIIGGAEVPMTAEEPTFYPEIHGEYGLGPIIPGIYEGIIENFFEIVKLIEKYEDELIIVNIGRLTSLATMFILFKTLMSKVKAYYIMGGAFWVPGNVTAVSEANFHADPIAVKIVLTYASNLTIIPLNVTDHAIVTPEMVNYIDYKGKAKLAKPLLDYYYAFYKKRNPQIKGSPVHDAITLMAPIHKEMFTYKTLPVHIVTANGGIHRGQSIVDIRPYMKFDEKAKTHRIAFFFDYPMFFNEFMSIMTGEPFG
ncbi:nucleoside hydrolase [Cytobacillus pseudoceanisediminis]|uniref:nucleoside hydrolase n=1 Tax=Cytobacillus pseudoceanisediminis TaxID=3051614 RepID=UPI003660DCA5